MIALVIFQMNWLIFFFAEIRKPSTFSLISFEHNLDVQAGKIFVKRFLANILQWKLCLSPQKSV